MATLEGVPPAELQRALGELSARDSMRPTSSARCVRAASCRCAW
jgi:hypothetical protein